MVSKEIELATLTLLFIWENDKNSRVRKRREWNGGLIY